MYGNKINEIKNNLIKENISNLFNLNYGLEYYPKYLYRQKMCEILKYEEILNKQLNKLNKQKNEINFILNISLQFIFNNNLIKITKNNFCNIILNENIINLLNLSNITIGILLLHSLFLSLFVLFSLSFSLFLFYLI